ncbi:unnamed protein product, partial [Didymodactylos carnosus]
TDLCLLVQTNYSCQCIGQTLYCYDLKLKHIPQLPMSSKFIQWDSWILAKNNFKYLLARSFAGHTIYTIDLDSNHLLSIEANAFNGINGSSLRQLILSNNNLSHVHPSVFQHVPNIQKLFLNNNQFRSSTTVFYLNNLEVLELDQQQNDEEEFLPDLSAVISLTALSLKSNRIRNLKSSNIFPSNLQSLKLTDNLIDRLSPRLFRFVPNLRYLYLDLNIIETIDPDTFLDTRYLLELNLAGNRLTLIPDRTVLEKLPYLKILNLSSNLLTHLLPNSFDTLLNLEELYLSQNQIYSISPYTFCIDQNPFQSLLSIDLSLNRLKTVDYCTFSDKNIAFINFDHSKQIRCSCSLNKLKSIDHIELKGYCNLNQHIMSLPSDKFEKCLNWTRDECKNSCGYSNTLDLKTARMPRQPKAVKDPNAPKRPLSTFFLFSQDERPKIKKDNPSLSVAEIAKVIGERWRGIGDDAKRKYEERAKTEKARYEKELADYKASK